MNIKAKTSFILGNERDVEIPCLFDFVASQSPISLLDVGAHYSWYYYAVHLRKLIKDYAAIDILEDVLTEKIVDHYYQANANEFSWNKDQLYDMVICISSIEHAGISTYSGDYRTERQRLFQTCFDRAKKSIYMTFPVGQASLDAGQFANITDEDLFLFEKIIEGSQKTIERFFYSEGFTQAGGWIEHDDKDFALQVPYDPSRGVQSVCIMEITK